MKYITLLFLSTITVSSGFAPPSHISRDHSPSTTSLWAVRSKIGKEKPVAEKSAAKEAKPGFSFPSFGGGGGGAKKVKVSAKKEKSAKKNSPAKKSGGKKAAVPTKTEKPTKAGFSLPAFGGGGGKKSPAIAEESKVSKKGLVRKKTALSTKKGKVPPNAKLAASKKSKPVGKKAVALKTTKTKAPQKTGGTVKVVQVARPNGSYEVKLVGNVPPFFKK